MDMLRGMASTDFDAGVKQLQSILDVFKNKELYETCLNELDKKKKELTKLVKVVGTVKDIENLLVQTETLKANAIVEIEILDSKKEEADTVITEAHGRAKIIEVDAASRARDQQNELDMREKALLGNRKQLDERDIEVRNTEEKVNGARLAVNAELGRLNQLQELATKARVDYEERRRDLERAIAGA